MLDHPALNRLCQTTVYKPWISTLQRKTARILLAYESRMIAELTLRPVRSPLCLTYENCSFVWKTGIDLWSTITSSSSLIAWSLNKLPSFLLREFCTPTWQTNSGGLHCVGLWAGQGPHHFATSDTGSPQISMTSHPFLAGSTQFRMTPKRKCFPFCRTIHPDRNDVFRLNKHSQH